jgi:pilus assembly protein Flp/PilA
VKSQIAGDPGFQNGKAPISPHRRTSRRSPEGNGIMTITRMLVMVQIAFGDLADRMRNADKERGATAVEYGLLVALIAGVIITVITLLGVKLQDVFTSVTNKLPGA